MTYLPGPVGYRLRDMFWRSRLRWMGRGVRIETGVRISGARYVSLDDECWIDRNVTIIAGPPTQDRATHERVVPDFSLGRGEVYVGKATHVAVGVVMSGIGGIWIGRNCTIASGSCVYSFSHHYRNLTDPEDRSQYSFSSRARLDQQAMIIGPVVVGDYAAVGLNSVLLPGACLKMGAWVAVGSVINGEVAEQTVYAPSVPVTSRSIAELTIKR